MGNSKTLITIQGINPDIYLKDEVKLSKFNLDRYSGRVIDSGTENALDATTNSFLKKIPGVDRMSDLKYFTSKKKYERCTEAVCNAVSNEAIIGRSVDIIAHSLGTCIALNSPVEAENVYLIGCPMGMKTWAANFVRMVTRKRGLKLRCKRLFYVYSPADFISHNLTPKIMKILYSYNVIPIVSDSHHGIQNYLDEIQGYREAVLQYYEI